MHSRMIVNPRKELRQALAESLHHMQMLQALPDDALDTRLAHSVTMALQESVARAAGCMLVLRAMRS